VQLRHAVIASSVWTVLAFGCCAGNFWYVSTHEPPGVRERPAGLLGQGVGVVGALGYAAIWAPYAYQVSRRRRQRREHREHHRRRRP
jgi:hypothetical protein